MENTDLEHARSVIDAEAEALRRLAQRLDERFMAAVELCERASGRVVVCGLGKSGHAGRKIAATLSSTNSPSVFLHATEALHGDLGGLCAGDVLIAIAKSGTTPEVIKVVTVARDRGIPVIALTNEPESELAALSTVVLLLAVESEADPNDLAPTSSVLATLALGDAIALTLMRRRGDGPASFAEHHPGGALGQRLLGGGA